MNEFQQNMSGGIGAAQLSPQGFFGGLIGGPLGGLVGRGIGGIFGNAGLGGHIGQMAGGIGGALLPFNVDPITAAAYAQQAQQAQMAQQQLAPQGWFGNALSQIGQPLGGAIGGLFGNQGLGQTIGGLAGQLGRMLPFNVDPVTAAYAQQALQAQQSQQLAPQGWFGNALSHIGQPLGGAIGGLFGNQGLGQTIGGLAGQLGRMLPFNVDPVTAAYAQQAQQAQMAQQQQQLAPQGWFGNALSQIGQPLGGAIGGLFGNQGLGQTIGGLAGQLGRILPFNVDPVTAAYMQQAQQAQMAQQQQQLAPQGWFGNALSHIGQPLGGAIGGLFGNQGLGQTIGGVAGQLGRFLPFNVDPVTAAYAQQAQQAQQQAQQALQGQQGQQANSYMGYQAGQGLGMPSAAGYSGQYIH